MHFMAWGRGKSGPKSAKTQPLCPHFCSFSLPLSLRRSSHQPGPPPASPPLDPPLVAIPTTIRPPPRLKQPPFLPLSLSLLQKSSSSPRGRLRPPLLAEKPPEPPAKPLDHGRDSCFVWAAPPPTSIFCSHFGCMQNVNHCSRSANN